jgi:ribosomal protein S18 acetylase RimI-like enzyme
VSASPAPGDAMARARAWRHAAHAAVCDTLAPWAHGTIVRAARYESYWDFNLVRVEDDPPLDADGLETVADEALAGLAHRRVDVEVIAAAERLRPGFEAKGWRTLRLVWMRHEAPPPPGPDLPVEEVPYDAVHALRVAWHGEDFPGQDAAEVAAYHAQAREVALRRGVQVLAVRERGVPVAFAHIERDGAGAEITQVYVRPEHRGAGRGTAMTRAAIAAAGEVRDLWIVADDEDRPKELYRRLGVRPAWVATEFLRLPPS